MGTTAKVRARAARRAGVAAGVLVAVLLGPAAKAGEFVGLSTLTQAEFGELVRDLGAAGSIKMLASAAPLGLTGFDVAAVAPFASIAHRATWSKASGGASAPGTVGAIGLRISKGLPGDIDIGATLGSMPEADAQWIGGELRWAWVAGGPVTPAMGVRASASRLTSGDNLAVTHAGVDLAVSKGIGPLTPYAGAGVVHSSGRARGVSTLASESAAQGRVFAGAHLNLGLLDLTVEGDRTGKTRATSLRVGFRF
jgi:hypothetical protein